MSRRVQIQPSAPIQWVRANPADLATFDPSTKVCTMNCGPHCDDPRSSTERKFLCDDCLTVSKEGGAA